MVETLSYHGKLASQIATLAAIVVKKMIFYLIYPTSSSFQQGIVLVNYPVVGESGIMDDMVKEYLPEVFAFIYVINSVNAGGIQRVWVRRSSDIVYEYL